MSQGQWEQHQPVKSSPSTLIKRLFIQPYLCVRLGFELGRDGWNNINKRARKVNSCPSPKIIFHGIASGET
jgi:hypothetical protein